MSAVQRSECSAVQCRAAPSTGIGIGIGIGPIPAFFDGIGIGKACYTSTNSVVDTLYVLLQ